MSNIKVPRSTYSKLEKYNLNSILYVSPTQKPGCAPSVSKETKEGFREDLGSFSLAAAVRYPYNCCRGCGKCDYGNLAGVT